MHTNVEERKGRERPEKRWIEDVKNEMKGKAVNEEKSADRDLWKNNTYYTDPKWLGNRTSRWWNLFTILIVIIFFY